MKTTWNDLLIQINGELYFADGNLASYDLKLINSTNIMMIGYSETLKGVLIQFNNLKRYIYEDVPKAISDELFNADEISVPACYVRLFKGYFRYEEVDYWVNKASLTDVCKHYRNMQYNLNTSLGYWATDRIDAINVIDKENFFWELEFQEQPDNCTRIK